MSTPFDPNFPTLARVQPVHIEDQPVGTTQTPIAAVQLYTFSCSAQTSNQIGPNIPTAGYRYLLFLMSLTAITAGSVNFRLRASGSVITFNEYANSMSAVGIQAASIGPGMGVGMVLMPNVVFEGDITTGPASFTVEVWGWS